MCDQHYPIATGICIECAFLKNITKLLCATTCDTTGAPPQPCFKCSLYYSSIEMMCGAPKCSSDISPNSLGVLDDPEDGLFSNKRSLEGANEVQTRSLGPVNCIPCYNLFTGYQLVCGDLFDYCPTSSCPSSSSPSPTATATPMASEILVLPIVSASPPPSPSITASSTPSSFPTPNVFPSQYNWYYYYEN